MRAIPFPSFEIAFWHPFGPHGREEPEDILERKQYEIERNGCTFWSFQYRRMLEDWSHELLNANPQNVFVFCSNGQGAIDPAREGTQNRPLDCQSYRLVGTKDAAWHPMPSGIRVPHPFRPRKTLASAFVVQQVLFPIESFKPPVVEWYSKKGSWRSARIPTRGEYLICFGGTLPMRNVRAVLELKPPYLAVVAADQLAG